MMAGKKTPKLTVKNLKTGLAVAALAFALDMQAVAFGADKLTFTSWGGVTQDAQMEAWSKVFTAETGIPVLADGPTDYGKFKAMVESGNVAWDVVDVEGDFAHQAAADGLLEPLDFSVINKADLDPRFVTDHAAGDFYWSFILAYNKDVLGNASPAGWGAVFDTKRYPGKRALYKWSSPGVLEMALLADGVAPDKLYPLDLDRAFRKLDTIKKDIIWWGSGAQSQQLIASSEVSMGVFWNNRIYSLQTSGANIGVSWEQNLATADFLVVPKGSKNKQAAMKFIAIATGVDQQANFANATTNGPVNLKAMEKVDAKILPLMSAQHADSQITLDFTYWAKNRDAIGERWYAWQAK
jgi:putative spermidine/putrescine transport system substrate-binding protein